MKKLGCAILALLMWSGQSSAALVQGDWKTVGDQLSTVDTKTGLEWIDLSQTRGYSITSILTHLQAGQKFAGWRLPTQNEVMTLISNAFGAGVLDIASSTCNCSLPAKGFDVPQIRDFARDIGGGYYSTVNYLYNGAYFRRDDGKQGMGGFIVNMVSSTSGWYFNPKTSYTSGTSGNSLYGVYLVSDGGLTLASNQDPSINIPEGTTAEPPSPTDVDAPALVFLGLLGFGLAAYRRKALR